MFSFRWLWFISFLYQYCISHHDSHMEEKDTVDKYLVVLDELIEVLEHLLQNIKSELEIKNLSAIENNTSLTEGFEHLSMITDSPEVSYSGMATSYVTENLSGTTTFETGWETRSTVDEMDFEETGQAMDGRNFSEAIISGVNLTSDEITLNSTLDNQPKVSSPLDYPLFNASSDTTIVNSYLKNDNMKTTELPLDKYLSDITSEKIPLMTHAFLISATILNNVSESENINATIFKNKHEGRDKRSTSEGYSVSNALDETLMEIKAELEEADLTEESVLKLEKYIKQIRKLKSLQSTKFNSSSLDLIIRDAKNLRKTIRIMKGVINTETKSPFHLSLMKRPMLLWACIILAVVFFASIILICLIIHCKVSNLNKKLNEIRSENTAQEECKINESFLNLNPRKKNVPGKSDFASNHVFNMERKGNFPGPLNSTKQNSSLSSFNSSRSPKIPPTDYDNFSLRRYDPETFEPIVPKVRYLEKNKKSLEF